MTILERNIRLLQDVFGIEVIYILVGHLAELMTEAVVSIQRKIPSIRLETSLWTEKGLAADVASLEDKINEPFITILGDEFYYKTEHDKFLKTWENYPNLAASIGVVQTNLLSRIRKNYSVELVGDQITNLIEKPSNPPNQILGLGSYLFTKEYFKFFHITEKSTRSGIVEITDVIDNMAKASTGKVYATFVNCTYFNINSMQDYHQAVYEIRHDQFLKFDVSLVVPSENNEKSISDVLVDFKNKTKEMLVVLGQSQDQTRILAIKEGAKVIDSSDRGLGAQIRKGIESCSGDIVLVVSPTASFRSKDYLKLMEYLKDSDMVIGTRTTRQMIEQGSNLLGFVRLANLIMGKLIEIFWWGREPRFTDASCLYFAIWKEAYYKIMDQLKESGDSIIAELMIEMVRSHMRCIEIPVSYFRPVEQKHYGIFRMIYEIYKVLILIIKKKL